MINQRTYLGLSQTGKVMKNKGKLDKKRKIPQEKSNIDNETSYNNFNASVRG